MEPLTNFSSPPKTVEASTSVADTAKRMEQWHVGAIVVVQGDEPIGLVTDRDLMEAGLLGKGYDAPVGDVASKPLITIDQEMDFLDAADFMRSKRIKRVGLHDASGALVGIISADDVMNCLGECMGNLSRAIQREFRVEKEPVSTTQSFFGKE